MMTLTPQYDKAGIFRKGVLPYGDGPRCEAEYSAFSVSESPETAVYFPEPPEYRGRKPPETPFPDWPVLGSVAAGILNAVPNPENVLFCAFRTPDWNAGLTPWPARTPFGEPDYSGKGALTGEFLETALIPEAENRNGTIRKRYFAGYSLGGLFAVWILAEKNIFAGAAAVSPSLWYPGFREYILPRARDLTGDLYLSLGTLERRSRNKYLRPCSKNCDDLFRAALNRPGFRTIFENTPGGHFDHPEGRLFRGISFLLQTVHPEEAGLPRAFGKSG